MIWQEERNKDKEYQLDIGTVGMSKYHITLNVLWEMRIGCCTLL